MKTPKKKNKITKCIEKLLTELKSKFKPEDKTQFEKNLKERHCFNNEKPDECYERIFNRNSKWMYICYYKCNNCTVLV